MTDLLLDHLKRALGDNYTIERELAGGGMSRVFVAREKALGREVVVKVLPRELSLGVNRERFQQEVQLAARLSHPYIVPLLHAGEHEELLWFTMPFISGESLKLHLERVGAMPVREVVQYSRDVAEALAYAHSRGVIHRDIKPANVLMDGGHGLVTDFGVAKALSAAMPLVGTGHTATGMAIGTPTYMAPEQLAADPAADHRVDIYAFGLLMYELLAGASPFATPSPTATMTAQLTRMPDPLEKFRSDVPPALSALITHCLAKNPDERPASAEEVLKALDQISGEMAAAVHFSGESTRSMKRMVPIIAGLALIAVIATAAAVMISNRDATPPEDTPTVAVIAPTTPTDVGNTVTIPAQTPMTRDDSLRVYSIFSDRFKTSQPKQTAAEGAAQLEQLDSLIEAAVKKRMDAEAAQGQSPRSGSGDPRNFPNGFPGGVPMRGLTTGTDLRTIYITSNSRALARDSSLRALKEALVTDITQRLGRGWTVVRDSGKVEAAQQAAAFAADAILNLTLERRGVARDSVELFTLIRTQSTGAFNRTADTVANPKGAGDFSKAMQSIQRLLNENVALQNRLRGGSRSGLPRSGGPGSGGATGQGGSVSAGRGGGPSEGYYNRKRDSVPAVMTPVVPPVPAKGGGPVLH